jgi:hypothetical protein
MYFARADSSARREKISGGEDGRGLTLVDIDIGCMVSGLDTVCVGRFSFQIIHCDISEFENPFCAVLSADNGNRFSSGNEHQINIQHK